MASSGISLNQGQPLCSQSDAEPRKTKADNFGDEDDHEHDNSSTTGPDQVYVVCILNLPLRPVGSSANYTFTQAEMNAMDFGVEWVGCQKHTARVWLLLGMQNLRASYSDSHLVCVHSDEYRLFRDDNMRDGEMLAKGWIAGPDISHNVMDARDTQ